MHNTKDIYATHILKEMEWFGFRVLKKTEKAIINEAREWALATDSWFRS